MDTKESLYPINSNTLIVGFGQSNNSYELSEEEIETYSKIFACSNCGHITTRSINKGTTIATYLHYNNHCTKCGCKDVLYKS